jgi:hypothetical protein
MKKRIKKILVFGTLIASTLALCITQAHAEDGEGQQPDSTPSEVVDTTETPNTTETPVVVTEQKEEVAETQKEETKNESKDWVKEVFSPSNIAMYFTWLAYIVTILGLAANIKKLRQSNNLTLKNVSTDVKKVLNADIKASVTEMFDKYLPTLVAAQEKTNKIMSIFAKILALSQENTPESRIAILDLIKELGVVEQELVTTAKQIVEDGQKAIEEHKESMNKQLDEIIEKYDGTSI